MARLHFAKPIVATAGMLGLIFAVAFSSTPAQALDKPVNLRVTSFITGSAWYVYSVTLGQLLRKHLPEGSKIDTPPLGGGTANPSLVSSGRADIGLGFTVANVWARDGKVFFKKPLTNLRALAGGLDQYYAGIALNEAKVTVTLEEWLKKHPAPKVVMLRKGSFGAYSGQQLLEMLGAGEEEVKKRGGSYTFTDYENIKSSFSSGRADLFLQLLTRGHPAFTEMAEVNDISFLGLSDETIQRMVKLGWRPAKFPANVFRGQEKELNLPGTTTSIFVRDDMDPDVAYAIVSAICDNENEFKSGHKALAAFDCSQAWKEELTGLPLHEGAKRYYREKGWLK
jgi:TRAP transporter TAXI family solute receptor